MTTGLKWQEVLPVSNAQTASTGLSLHELLMGWPMSTVTNPPMTPHKTTFWIDEFMTILKNKETKILRKYHLYVSDRLPEPSEEPIHPFKEGNFVLIKSLEKVSLSPRWKGLYQVLLTTRTALKVKGRVELIHATRCRLSPQAAGKRVQSANSCFPLCWLGSGREKIKELQTTESRVVLLLQMMDSREAFSWHSRCSLPPAPKEGVTLVFLKWWNPYPHASYVLVTSPWCWPFIVRTVLLGLEILQCVNYCCEWVRILIEFVNLQCLFDHFTVLM